MRRAPVPLVALALVALGVGSCGTPGAAVEPRASASSPSLPLKEAPPLVLPLGRIAARTVAVSDGSTCALLVDTSVWCVGPRYNGKRMIPVVHEMPIPPARVIKAVEARTYALTEDGDVYQWGQILNLGQRDVPVKLDVSGVTDLAVAGNAVCVRSPKGWVCRDPRTNEPTRELGADVVAVSARAAEICAATDASVTCEGAPGDREGSAWAEHRVASVVELAASAAWTCARSRAGRVTCWRGADPTELAPFGDRAFVALDSASYGVCARPLRGQAACVRDNDDAPEHAKFAALDDVLRGHRDLTSVVPGRTGACFVEAGVVTCWGHAHASRHTAEPEAIDFGDLMSLRASKDVAAGAGHTCVLGVDGIVRCWGQNVAGSLGVGDDDHRVGPERWSGVPPMDHVAARASMTCAVGRIGTADGGRVLCAGGFHERGVAPTCDPNAPLPCSLAPKEVATGATDVALGVNFGCVLDAGPDAGVRCWGKNDVGQLGAGDRVDSATPRPVIDAATGAPLKHARKVIAGALHACAIVDAPTPGEGSSLVCWGYDDPGVQGRALGDGDLEAGYHAARVSASPVPLSGGVTDASDRCVVLDGGEARCWGALGPAGYAVVPSRIGACDATAAGATCVLGPRGVTCSAGDVEAASSPYTGPPIVEWAIEGRTSCTVDADHHAACREHGDRVPLFGPGPPFLTASPTDACPADSVAGMRPPMALWAKAVVSSPPGAERPLREDEVRALAEGWNGPPATCDGGASNDALEFRFEDAFDREVLIVHYLGPPCDVLRDTRDKEQRTRKLTTAGRAVVKAIASELGVRTSGK